MPARPTLTNTTKVELGYTGPNGTRANNIFYVLTSGDISSLANLATLAADIVTGLGSAHANWVSIMSPVWTLASVTAIDNSGATENVSENSPDTEGTMGGTPYPPQVAVGVTWKINAHYRGGHPRWYLPSPSSASISVQGSNMMAASYVTAVEAAAATLLSYINALTVATFTVTLGTISFETAHAPRATPVFRAFQSATVSDRFDTQRRRLGKEPRAF